MTFSLKKVWARRGRAGSGRARPGSAGPGAAGPGKERHGKDMVYLLSDTGKPGLYKIGRSKNPEQRRRQLQTGNGSALRIVCVFEGNDVEEGFLHRSLWRFKAVDGGQ